jgi:hypothetical protein
MASIPNENLTDEEVEAEIERLRQSPMVALARKEQRIRYRRRQALYQLRSLERKGIELSQSGITMEFLNGMESADDLERELMNYGK